MATPHGRGVRSAVYPLTVSTEAARQMARYSLRAYHDGNATNSVKGLLFTPKPVGSKPLPMVVYLPGNGERGDVARQFRQDVKALKQELAKLGASPVFSHAL